MSRRMTKQNNIRFFDIRLDRDILPDAVARLCIFTNISTNVNELKALP